MPVPLRWFMRKTGRHAKNGSHCPNYSVSGWTRFGPSSLYKPSSDHKCKAESLSAAIVYEASYSSSRLTLVLQHPLPAFSLSCRRGPLAEWRWAVIINAIEWSVNLMPCQRDCHPEWLTRWITLRNKLHDNLNCILYQCVKSMMVNIKLSYVIKESCCSLQLIGISWYSNTMSVHYWCSNHSAASSLEYQYRAGVPLPGESMLCPPSSISAITCQRGSWS